MTGIPRITERDQVADGRPPIFDAIPDSRGRVSRPLSVLLDSPAVAGRAAHPGSYIRFESTLAPQHRELAVITAAA